MTSERDETPETSDIETDELDTVANEVDESEHASDEFEPDGEDVTPPDSGSADDATESIRELVTYLVNNLVDEPESVEISLERRGPALHVQLRLPEGDLGKVIGRGGRIAKAIRTVLLIAGSKHHLRVSLDIES